MSNCAISMPTTLTSIWQWKHHYDQNSDGAVPPKHPSEGNATLQCKQRHVPEITLALKRKREKFKIDRIDGVLRGFLVPLIGLILTFRRVCLTTVGTSVQIV